MAVMLMAKAFGINVGNAGKKLVLLKLADNANDKGECWPSYQHIADQCEISKRSAMKYIDELVADGLIEKRTRKGPKGNSTNIYMVTLRGADSSPHSEQDSLGSEQDSLGSEQDSLGSEQAAPGGSEQAAPGISHSFESVSESVSESLGSASDDESPAGAGQDVARNFPLKDGSNYTVPEEFVDELKNTYRRLDVEHHLKRARLWLIAAPSRQKTRRGMTRFLNGWMSRQKPTAEIHPIQSRHNGFDERDYSEGLIEGVSDDAANF